MNPFTKNAVIAGLVALVVALGVVFGARAISPTDMNSGVAVKVMAPDGSVVGTTEPIKMASSGPPVPACSVVNTKLNCPGAGLPLDWVPVTFGDSGLNEAFGALVPGTYTIQNLDAGTGYEGFPAVAKATITPVLSGDFATTGSLTGGVTSDAGTNLQIVIFYSLHNDAGTAIPVSAVQGLNGISAVGTAGAFANLEAGVSYDVYLVVAYGTGTTPITYVIPDASYGGIWVHEFP